MTYKSNPPRPSLDPRRLLCERLVSAMPSFDTGHDLLAEHRCGTMSHTSHEAEREGSKVLLYPRMNRRFSTGRLPLDRDIRAPSVTCSSTSSRLRRSAIGLRRVPLTRNYALVYSAASGFPLAPKTMRRWRECSANSL